MKSVLTLLLATALAGSGGLIPVDESGYRNLLESRRGKVVLVDFWATWCEPCRTEMPLLVDLEKRWREQGLVLLTISADDPEQEQEAREFLRKTGVALPAWQKRARSDEDFINSIDPQWSGALPALFLYDRNGRKAASFIGETGLPEIEAALRKLL